MAKKGGSSHLKRISSYRALRVPKKTSKWLTGPGPGPHPGLVSLPMRLLVRDYLKLAANARETSYILNNCEVLVDGKAIKAKDFPVGLMDAIVLPKLDKSYRVGIDSHQRLVLNEISREEAGSKLCKIKRKTTDKGGKVMLGLHDGKTIAGDNNYRIGDTVKITVPGNNVEKLLKIEPGARCLITKGKHAGKVGKLKEIRTVGNRKTEAYMDHEDGNFITVKQYLFVVE